MRSNNKIKYSLKNSQNVFSPNLNFLTNYNYSSFNFEAPSQDPFFIIFVFLTASRAFRPLTPNTGLKCTLKRERTYIEVS